MRSIEKKKKKKRNHHLGHVLHLFKHYWHSQSQRNGRKMLTFCSCFHNPSLLVRLSTTLAVYWLFVRSSRESNCPKQTIPEQMTAIWNVSWHILLLVMSTGNWYAFYFNEQKSQSLGKHASDEQNPWLEEKCLGLLLALQMTGPKEEFHGLSQRQECR